MFTIELFVENVEKRKGTVKKTYLYQLCQDFVFKNSPARKYILELFYSYMLTWYYHYTWWFCKQKVGLSGFGDTISGQVASVVG